MTVTNPFVHFALVLVFCDNLRVVVQCINLLVQDESLSPVSIWKFYVLKALISGSYHQTLLVSAELFGVSITLCAYATEIVNKPVMFLFSCLSFSFTISVDFFLPNWCFVFLNVLLLHASSLLKWFTYLFLFIFFLFIIPPSPDLCPCPTISLRSARQVKLVFVWLFLLSNGFEGSGAFIQIPERRIV